MLKKQKGSIKLMAMELAKEEGSWQQILRTIDASNSMRGVKVTKKDLTTMVENFNANVLNLKPNELQVNYSHTSWEKAAGWITELRIKGRFLEAQIRWTPQAATAIEDEEFRFFSAEFAPSWQNVETEEVFLNVLLGAALTNIPFVPGMKPVALSDVQEGESKCFLFHNHSKKMEIFKSLLSALQGNVNVSLAEATILRTQFSSIEEADQAEFSESVEAVEKLAKENGVKLEKEATDAKAKMEKLSTDLAEATEKLAAGVTGDAQVSKLAADLKESQKASKELQSQMDKLSLERRTEIVQKKVEELADAGKILPKDISSSVEIALSQGNVEKQDKFLEYLDGMASKVDFSVKGDNPAEEVSEDAKISKINKLASEAFASDKSKNLGEWIAHFTREEA